MTIHWPEVSPQYVASSLRRLVFAASLVVGFIPGCDTDSTQAPSQNDAGGASVNSSHAGSMSEEPDYATAAQSLGFSGHEAWLSYLESSDPMERVRRSF